jgi:hypothetical protein
VALHLLKARSSQLSRDIGETHFDINKNANPNRDNVLRLSKGAWELYHLLYRTSQTARYEGITDFDTFQALKKADYIICQEALRKFKLYLNGVGLKC